MLATSDNTTTRRSDRRNGMTNHPVAT
jgi:hypothetical protein